MGWGWWNGNWIDCLWFRWFWFMRNVFMFII
jgi:hypothetical protein